MIHKLRKRMPTAVRATRCALFNARARCHNPSHSHYRNYGGRGITVHPVFMDPDTGIQAFIDEVGIRPGPEFTLDRIDVDKGYEPGNLRWATRQEQQENRRKTRISNRTDYGWGTYSYKTKRGNIQHRPLIADVNGIRRTVMEWAEELGISSTTIIQRVDRGWPVEMILSPKKRP